MALNACAAATLKIYVYVFCKSREAGYGVVATDITSVKEVANSSLSHETFYRQANCISLSKALSIVSKYSPLYSSFEIYIADRFFHYLPGSTLCLDQRNGGKQCITLIRFKRGREHNV